MRLTRIGHVHFNHHNFTIRQADKYVESIIMAKMWHLVCFFFLNSVCVLFLLFRICSIHLLIEYSLLNVDEQCTLRQCLHFSLNCVCEMCAVYYSLIESIRKTFCANTKQKTIHRTAVAMDAVD